MILLHVLLMQSFGLKKDVQCCAETAWRGGRVKEGLYSALVSDHRQFLRKNSSVGIAYWSWFEKPKENYFLFGALSHRLEMWFVHVRKIRLYLESIIEIWVLLFKKAIVMSYVISTTIKGRTDLF